MEKGKSFKYEQSLVAFMDILGFKEIITQSESEPNSYKVETIYSILNYFKEWEIPGNWDLKFIEIEEDAQWRGIPRFDIKNKTNITSFSDSIVISVKTTDNVNEMFSTLVANLGYLGTLLLENNVLWRGGITLGKIFHHKNGIVYGPGMIEAFSLEHNYSKYPRIILSDKLIGKLNYPLKEKCNRYPYHQYLKRFNDGTVGFHQMQFYEVIQSWEKMSFETLRRKMDTIREVIINGLDNSFETPNVFMKYNWLKEQYNELIILDYYAPGSKSIEDGIVIKKPLHEFNENSITSHNIHFSLAESVLNKKE